MKHLWFSNNLSFFETSYLFRLGGKGFCEDVSVSLLNNKGKLSQKGRLQKSRTKRKIKHLLSGVRKNVTNVSRRNSGKTLSQREARENTESAWNARKQSEREPRENIQRTRLHSELWLAHRFLYWSSSDFVYQNEPQENTNSAWSADNHSTYMTILWAMIGSPYYLCFL